MQTRKSTLSIRVFIRLFAILTVAMELMPFIAWADGTQHIVFSLEGILVQALPRSAAAKLKPDEVIQTGNYYYRIEPYARDLIEALNKRGDVDISIYSDLKKAYVQQILAAIKLPSGKTLSQVTSKVLTGEDMIPVKDAENTHTYEGDVAHAFRKDLTKVDSNTANVVLVDNESDIAVDGQEKSVLNIGPSYYAFESFADAQAAAAQAEKDDPEKFKNISRYFPKTEAEWKSEHDKMLKTFAVLDSALDEKTKKPLADRVKSARGNTTVSRAKLAQLTSYNVWQLSADKSQVTGCLRKSKAFDDYEVSAPKSECISSLPTRPNWQSEKSTACVLETSEGARVQSVAQSQCLTDALVSYEWKDDEAKICGKYTIHHVYLGLAQEDDCGGPVAQDLRKVIKTEKHDTYVYHYVTHQRLAQDINKAGPVDPNDSLVRQHVEKWASYFNNPTRNTSQNAGLYLANEPLSTYPNYGGYDFVLYRINLPKGTRYIFDRESLQFSPESIAELKKQGCEATRLQDLTGSGNPGTGISSACAVALSKYMKSLHIAELTYAYGTLHPPGCDAHADIAYVLAQPDLIPKANIQVFTPEPPASGAAREEAVMIEKMAMSMRVSSPYSKLLDEAKAVPDDKYNAWIGKHIQGCEKLAPPEPIVVESKAPCRKVAADAVPAKVRKLHGQVGAVSNAVLNANPAKP
jgi:hypothetical protein